MINWLKQQCCLRYPVHNARSNPTLLTEKRLVDTYSYVLKFENRYKIFAFKVNLFVLLNDKNNDDKAPHSKANNLYSVR